jgi:hypothetical protein
MLPAVARSMHSSLSSTSRATGVLDSKAIPSCTSEYLLMKFILGQERQPMADGRDGWQTLTKIAAYLRSLQRDDGSWGQYPGSASPTSAPA